MIRNFVLAASRFCTPQQRQSGVAKSARINLFRVQWITDCSLRVGENSIVSAQIFFEKEGARVSIGSSTFIGASKLVAAEGIEIGDDVLISWGVTIVDHDSHSTDWSKRAVDVANWYNGKKVWDHVNVKPVRIGSRAWLGFDVTILKGVSIGEGAIVGAGSVVRQDVERYTVVAGNPAVFVRRLVAQ